MASEFELTDVIGTTDRSAFEPRVPDLIGNESFVFVRTTGVRYAPELLVVELFREVFFDPFSPETKERQLSPEAPEFSRAEQAILYVARGRLKLTKHGGAEGFYAPVFPEQARVSWLRKKSDRALRQHLLQGALAHSLKHATSDERRQAAETIVDSLRGRNRASSATDVLGKEILSAATANVEIESAHGMRDRTAAVEELAEAFESVKHALPSLSLGDADPLAARIREDFIALCEMEGELPRLLWLDFLKCFLRLAVPAWVLAQMKVTVLLRDWALAALEGRPAPHEPEIRNALSSRREGLFHPTRTGTNELAMHVERYMKARVELSILLYLLKSRGNERLFDLRLSISSIGARLLSVDQLLCLFGAMPLRGGSTAEARSQIHQSLVRGAETFAAWANPLRKGQGKNIDEFLRSLRRFEPAEADTGYLAERAAPGHAVIFPGPAMIRLLLLLAALEKMKKHPAMRGKLVLADLERHFDEYGLQFSVSAGARPRLIAELARLGLLKGSPDAGDYTELLVPANVARSSRQASRAAGNAE